jgi:hypothetical protein
MPWPQPFFDAAGGVYPSFHVLRGLARLAGRELLAADSSTPREVMALAARGADEAEIWIANLTGEPRRVTIEPSPARARVAVLDAAQFVAAAADPERLDRADARFSGSMLELDAYAVARLLPD